MTKQTKLIGARAEFGISQQLMADYLGLSIVSYAKRENGTRDFRLDEAFILADYFNRPVEELFIR